MRRLQEFLALFFRFETGSGWRLSGLDGLRGVAASLVVFAHAYDEKIEGALVPPRIPALHQFLRTGGAGGVMLFFALSGFLLYLPWARSHIEQTSPPTWRQYVARRCLRIMPAYYAIVLLLAFVPMVFGAPFVGFGRLGMHFIFLPALTSRYPGLLGVFWTLQVEEFYYWSLPLLHVVFRRGRHIGLGLCIVAAVGYTALILGALPSRYWVGLLNQTPFHLLSFGSGMACALTYASDRLQNRQRDSRLFLAMAVVAYLAATWLYTWVVEIRPELQSLVSVAFLPGCVAAVYAAAHGAAATILSSSALRFLGAISYSLYLWHLVFIRLLPMPSPVVPHLATRIAWSFFAAVAFSTLNFLIIERPFLKLRPHTSARPNPAATRVVVEA